jgi:hypothetical protein
MWRHKVLRRSHCKSYLLPHRLSCDISGLPLILSIRDAFQQDMIGLSSCRCHKLILAAWSDVFAAMFKSGMKEEMTDVVEIACVNPDAMQSLINYCYSEHLDIQPGNALEILQAADRFNISSAVNLVSCCAAILFILQKSVSQGVGPPDCQMLHVCETSERRSLKSSLLFLCKGRCSPEHTSFQEKLNSSPLACKRGHGCRMMVFQVSSPLSGCMLCSVSKQCRMLSLLRHVGHGWLLPQHTILMAWRSTAKISFAATSPISSKCIIFLKLMRTSL